MLPADAGGAREGFQKWLSTGRVDFLEIFAGHGAFTASFKNGGWVVGPPVDIKYESLGLRWNLSRASDQNRLAYLITKVLRPALIHLGIPCTKLCQIGQRQGCAGASGEISLETNQLVDY